MTTQPLNQTSQTSQSADFVSYIDAELVAIFKKEYGNEFDVVIDMEMKNRTRDIMERHARRYGRTLEQDNSRASQSGFYFAYTPNGYLYGQPISSHKALEWLTGETTSNDIEVAKSKASEINFQGENLINHTNSLQDSDNSRHTFAQRRKLQTSIATSLDKYTELDKWW